jgi:hypothetical protein
MKPEASAEKISENGVDRFLRNVGIFSKLNGVSSQKLVIFIQDKPSADI